MNRCRGLALLCGLTSVLIFLWLGDGVGGLRGYTYNADELQTMTMSQALLETGNPQTPTRLGAPGQADWRDFPLITPIDFGWVWLFGRAGADCFQATTLTFWINIALTGAAACLAFRELQLSAWAAFSFGIVYTLQSSLWEQNLTHPHVLFPFVAGVSVALLRLAQGGWPDHPPRWLLGMSFLQGLSSLYLTFFAYLLWPFATWLGWVRQGRGVLRQALLWLAALTLGVMLHALPLLLARGRPQAAPPGKFTVRFVSESELYGLKLRILLSPRPGHPLSTLNWLAEQLHQPFPDDQSEVIHARLGSLASVGLMLALGCCLGLRRKPVPADWAPAASQILLYLFVLATVGGLGAIFNALIFDKFRCYCRILVFFSFFCLALTASLLDRPRLRRVLLLLPLLAGIDQFIPLQRCFPTRAQNFASDRAWIQQLESDLPPGSMVYQFPYTRTLGPPPLFWLPPQAPALGYLHGRTLRWSWGDLNSELHEQLEPLSWEERLQQLKTLGFRVFWLDRHGLGPEAYRVEAELIHYLGPPRKVSPDTRYWLFWLEDLRPAGPPAQIQAVVPPRLPETEAQQIQLSFPAPVQPLPMITGHRAAITVKIHNPGPHWAWSGGPQPIHLAYHWTDRQGNMVTFDGHRLDLPAIAPDSDRAVVLLVDAPPGTGSYWLQVRLVQEGVRWFEGPGFTVLPDIPVVCGWR